MLSAVARRFALLIEQADDGVLQFLLVDAEDQFA